MALRLIAAPLAEPISLAEAKAHLRVDHSDDDATIMFLITVARQHLDAVSGWFGRALITQTWDLVLDAFPPSISTSCWCPPLMSASGMSPSLFALQIPWPPLQSVTSIKYVDANDTQQIMPATDYMVDTVSTPGWVIPITAWPSHKSVANAIEIRFIAGFGDDATDVPAPIRHALLLLLGHWYENREQVLAQYEGGATVLPMPFGVEHLLSPFRQILV